MNGLRYSRKRTCSTVARVSVGSRTCICVRCGRILWRCRLVPAMMQSMAKVAPAANANGGTVRVQCPSPHFGLSAAFLT